GKGTWYNATFVVDEERRISADFDYENPPFGGVADDDDPDSEGDADPELLLEDHRMLPRDPDVLPEWHPARTAGPAVSSRGRAPRQRSCIAWHTERFHKAGIAGAKAAVQRATRQREATEPRVMTCDARAGRGPGRCRRRAVGVAR